MKRLLPITATLTLLAGAEPTLAEDNLVYVAVDPCRIADTRKSGKGAIKKNASRNFLVTGSAGELAAQGGQKDCPNPKSDQGLEPVAVAAYYVAVPAQSSTGAGILAAYPSDDPKPAAGTGATLNFAEGQVIGNTSITTLCNDNEKNCPGDGALAVMSRDTDEHVVIDVQGYFYPQTGLPGYQMVENTVTRSNIRQLAVDAKCPDGKIVISGGGGLGANSDWIMDSSYPLGDASGWRVVFKTDGNTFGATGTARAICIDW